MNGYLCALVALSTAVNAIPVVTGRQYVLADRQSELQNDDCASHRVTDLPGPAQAAIYLLDRDCVHPDSFQVYAPAHDQELYWLSPSVIEKDDWSPAATSAQTTFAARAETEDVIASLDDGRLVLLTPDQVSAMTSSPDYARTEFLRVPFEPAKEVPQSAIDRMAHETDSIAFNVLIDKILSTLPRKQIIRDVKTLSGEDQSHVPAAKRWRTRHSMSEGVWRAKDWIKHELGHEGGFDECEEHDFRTGFVPMIACTIRGRSLANETVVIGAHFDSRGTFGNITAPGADDDGSGTALILSVAKEIRKHRLTFERNVIIAAFSGEEQGLVGSAAFALLLRERNEDVVMMLQVDMVGFRKAGEPLQMAFPDLIGLTEARHFVGNVSTLYVPELALGFTPACCSDHQSFVNEGYPSTWVFERMGPIADPCYHDSCDLSDRPGYDFEQIHLITKVVLASVLQLARFSFL